MRKQLITILASVFILPITAFANELAVGITGNFSSVDTDGTETLRTTAVQTTGGATEEILIPEVFVEIVGDRGAVGIAYIPVQEMGSKSRKDTNSEADTGTYTAKAELDSHVMFYGDLNLANLAGHDVFAKLGYSIATISTLESLNSGSTYADQDVHGVTVGLGAKADIASNLYYKVEGTYTNYDGYSDTATSGNKVEADTEVTSLKVSVAYKF